MSHTPLVERLRIAFASREKLLAKAKEITARRDFKLIPELRKMRDRRVGAVALEDASFPLQRTLTALFA